MIFCYIKKNASKWPSVMSNPLTPYSISLLVLLVLPLGEVRFENKSSKPPISHDKHLHTMNGRYIAWGFMHNIGSILRCCARIKRTLTLTLTLHITILYCRTWSHWQMERRKWTFDTFINDVTTLSGPQSYGTAKLLCGATIPVSSLWEATRVEESMKSSADWCKSLMCVASCSS